MSNFEERYAVLQEVRRRLEKNMIFQQAQSALSFSSGIALALEMTKSLSQKIQMKSARQSFDYMRLLLDAMPNAATATILNCADYSAVQDVISAMSNQLASLRLGQDLAMHGVIADVCKRLSDCQLNGITNGITISHEMAERISAVMTAAVPYMGEEKQDEHCEAILPRPSEKKATFLTFDRAVSLLSFLISLYALVVTLMPNPQLTKITEQNEELIAIEEERLELERQKAEHLEDIANNLSDIIIYLDEQIETQAEESDILGHQVEDADGFGILQGQDAETDRQENDAGAEN